MKLYFILNRNTDGIIGVNNNLFASIPDDLKWFKRHTKNNIVMMGYNTWCSLKKTPLSDRINIILTKNNYDSFSGMNDGNVLPFKSFEDSKEYLSETYKDKKIFVIGGSQLYDYIYINYPSLIEAMYITEVHHKLDNIDRQMISKCDIIPSKEYLKIYNKECSSEGIVYGDKTQLLSYEFTIYQSKKNMNTNEQQYLQLLRKIFDKKNMKSTRNSEVFSSFGEKMIFDLRDGFPLLTTKKMGYKTILRELLWFLSGSTDNKVLQSKNVRIWDQNASKEFLETRGLDYEEGDLGPVYGFQWRHFGAEYKGADVNYRGKGVDQIKYIIDTIKNDPTSRRIIMSAWNPCDIDKMALPPCHVMVQFSVDREFLDAQLYQRSGDMFLGVPYNIASYSFLLHIIAKLTNYKARYLYHVLGDTHIYSNHFDVVQQQLERIPYQFPNLKLRDFKDINQITEEDFSIEDYQSYSALKTNMIA
jgi:thymidylate synthase